MRVAETRAVNRALRKAYGIGLCSVEEIGFDAQSAQSRAQASKLPPQPTNGNYGSPKVRDPSAKSFASINWIPTW
jgi:hypothetical protein